MRSRILRTLMLACSLTLALPQGWCCLFAIQSTEKVATETGPICSKAGTSGCCCPCSTPQPRKSDKSPAKPVPVQNCPCTERIATVTTSPVEKADVDLGFVAILPDLALPYHEVGVVESVGRSVYAPPRSLHIMHCLWLC